MSNIKAGTLTLLLAEPHTEIATNKIKEIVNDLSKKSIPTLVYEFNSKTYYEDLNANEDNLKGTKIYVGKSQFIENIIKEVAEHKELYDIQYLVIDGLETIQARNKYCLGRADIVSIIIKQLKELAQEQKICIIATAPISPKTTTNDLENDKSKVLSYFCNAETAQEYIDNIYLLDMDIIQKLNDYGFSNQVKKILIDYCNSKPSVGKDYILSVAESWHKNNIKTEEDLDNYLKKYEILDEINTKISKIIDRPTTEYEKLYIEKWIYKNNIDEKQLIELVKSNRTNFDRIDKIISNKN